jgi:hypothetical protein
MCGSRTARYVRGGGDPRGLSDVGDPWSRGHQGILPCEHGCVEGEADQGSVGGRGCLICVGGEMSRAGYSSSRLSRRCQHYTPNAQRVIVGGTSPARSRATVKCEGNKLFHYSDEQAGGTIRCRCGRFVSLAVVAITHRSFAGIPAAAWPQRSSLPSCRH